MGLNIVVGQESFNKFSKSNFFRQNLGLVATVDKNGGRVYNEKDKFAFFYNSRYRTVIYAKGNIGDVRFYLDHYIKDSTFAVYHGDIFEEFLFTFDDPLVKEKGIDFYIGHIFKKTEEDYLERVKNEELKKAEVKPKGNPDKLKENPGNVSYEDVKAYLDKKNKERYKT